MSEPLAVCRNQSELHLALRARADTLQLSREDIGEIAGLAAGHSNKILMDPPMRGLGPVTLFPMIGALGLMIALVEDPVMTARLKKRPRRIGFNVRSGPSHWRNAGGPSIIQKMARRYGLLGAKLYMKKVSPERRSEIARSAARARWRRERKLRRDEQSDQGRTNGHV